MIDRWLQSYSLATEQDADLIGRHIVGRDLVRIRCAEAPRTDACVAACVKHIALASFAGPALQRTGPQRLPHHLGYEQLVVAFEERGRLCEALRMAQQAHAEGWSGNWPGRIRRLQETLDQA